MTNIPLNILAMSVGFGTLLGIINLYSYWFYYPTSNRKYWKKRDVINTVIRFCISLILVVSWFVFIKYFKISIGLNQNTLNNYLYFTMWVLGFIGAYLVYKLLKYFFNIIAGIIMLIVQRKSKHINNLLLKAINDDDSTTAINNTKLLIQSSGYIDIGQEEFNKLLLMLFSDEEYKTAHILTQKRVKINKAKATAPQRI